MEKISIIGIKTADGAFYPILEKDFDGKKKLVLTTVRDNQETVQIDLYQKKSEEDESKQYVGSLVIENIQLAPKGDPEIEVIMGIDTDGNLNAIASDVATGNKQRLTTSLENLNEDELFDVPDFDLDDSEENGSDVTMLREPDEDMTVAEENDEFTLDEDVEDMTIAEESNDMTDDENKEPKKKGNPILMLLIILIGLAAIAGIIFLIFFLINQNKTNGKPEIEDLVENTDNNEIIAMENDSEKKNPEETDASISDTAVQDSENTVTDTTVIEENKQLTDDTEIITEQTDKTETSENDFEYIIKWGDTLWDLSATFYRDPLKYPVIAEYKKNNISDPDFILANTKLYIPEQ